jgi:acyl-coenzyme A thioesterase PaaI-like protein
MDVPNERAAAERLERVPLAFAIGMRIGADADGTAEATMPGGATVSGVDGATDPLALLPFLDQLSSAPLVAGSGGLAMATIDLAVHLLASPGAGPLHGVAHAPAGAGAARHVTGEVRDADGRVVATSTAWFSIGAPPGGGEGGGALPVPAFTPRGPFQAMLGLAPDGEDAAVLAPDVAAAIGWVGMPALHGGAIAAVLARAAQRRVETLGRGDLRLASLAVRFLRAADTSGTRAQARVDAIGRRTARLSVTARTAGHEVASAQALFVAGDA